MFISMDTIHLLLMTPPATTVTIDPKMKLKQDMKHADENRHCMRTSHKSTHRDKKTNTSHTSSSDLDILFEQHRKVSVLRILTSIIYVIKKEAFLKLRE